MIIFISCLYRFHVNRGNFLIWYFHCIFLYLCLITSIKIYLKWLLTLIISASYSSIKLYSGNSRRPPRYLTNVHLVFILCFYIKIEANIVAKLITFVEINMIKFFISIFGFVLFKALAGEQSDSMIK